MQKTSVNGSFTSKQERLWNYKENSAAEAALFFSRICSKADRFKENLDGGRITLINMYQIFSLFRDKVGMKCYNFCIRELRRSNLRPY